MDSVLKSAKSIFTLKELNVDNAVYKLHYKVSFGLCLVGTALLGAKQYFGDPIKCHVTSGSVDKALFESHCWLHGSTHLQGELGRRSEDCTSFALDVSFTLEQNFANLDQILQF